MKPKKGGMPSQRHKRQVRGKQHAERLYVYLSKEEKALVEKAAEMIGVSASQFGSGAVVSMAKATIAGTYQPRI